MYAGAVVVLRAWFDVREGAPVATVLSRLAAEIQNTTREWIELGEALEEH